MEKFPVNSVSNKNNEPVNNERGNDLRPVEHERVLIGMFAKLGGEVVKIISIDRKHDEAVVAFANCDYEESVLIKDLEMLITTKDVKNQWSGSQGK